MEIKKRPDHPDIAAYRENITHAKKLYGKRTQADQIHDLLKAGPVTAMDALQKADCFRLAARIHDLKAKGINIKKRDKHLASGKTIAEYYLNAE